MMLRGQGTDPQRLDNDQRRCVYVGGIYKMTSTLPSGRAKHPSKIDERRKGANPVGTPCLMDGARTTRIRRHSPCTPLSYRGGIGRRDASHFGKLPRIAALLETHDLAVAEIPDVRELGIKRLSGQLARLLPCLPLPLLRFPCLLLPYILFYFVPFFSVPF
jgi:hypothetical protein